MNKYEREVARSQLESERKVLEELEKIYSQAAADITKRLEITNGKIEIMLSEIDKADEKTLSVLQSQIYQRDFQKNIKKQLDFILESLNDNQYPKIYDYLKKSYDNGFIGTLYSLNMSGIPVNIPIDPVIVARAIHIESKLSKKLYESLGEDVEILKKRVTNSISRGIASGMHYSEISLNIANNSKSGVNNAMRIVRTEGGRIYSNTAIECGKAAKEKTGADLIKQWDSTLDGSTREHHRQLDGQVRELEEDFEVGNRKTSAPLHFGIPGEDINCRCISLIKPRWDVDSRFTKRDNETGELMEFADIKSYEEFKKKYWKVVDNSSRSGIIKSEIEKGNIKLELNHEKQAKHIKGEPEYKEGKSYLTISEAGTQEIIYRNYGTGILVYDRNGNWKHKELIDCGEEIGVVVDTSTGVETITDKGTIHYSKTGTHLVPRKEENND